MEQGPIETPSPDTLYAVALYLTTNYARSGCPRVCHMIMRKLMCILNHPSESVSPALRETCRRLHVEWARIASERALALDRMSNGIAESVESIH